MKMKILAELFTRAHDQSRIHRRESISCVIALFLYLLHVLKI